MILINNKNIYKYYEDTMSVIYRPIPKVDFAPIPTNDIINNMDNFFLENFNLDNLDNLEINYNKTLKTPANTSNNTPDESPENSPTSQLIIEDYFNNHTKKTKSNKNIFKIDTNDFDFEFFDKEMLKNFLTQIIFQEGEFLNFAFYKTNNTHIVVKMRKLDNIVDYIVKNHILKIN